MATLVDDSGTTRFEGTIGYPNCILECQPDVHDQAPIPFLWDALYDNDFNAITAIPDGLGLAFAFDGSDQTITTTEAGTWAFTLGLTVNADATWMGLVVLDSSRYAGAFLDATADVQLGSTFACIAETVSFPVGATIAPEVDVRPPATTDPFVCDCYLTIVRLG